MAYILAVCQIILSLVFILAAAGKLVYPQQFIRVLRAAALPEGMCYVAAALTVSCELELALHLVFSTIWSLPFVFIGAFLLMGAFTGWLGWMYLRRPQMSCGCFGASQSRVGRGNFIRNGVLMMISAIGFFCSLKTTSFLPSPSLWIWGLSLLLISITFFLFLKRSQVSATGTRPLDIRSVEVKA